MMKNTHIISLAKIELQLLADGNVAVVVSGLDPFDVERTLNEFSEDIDTAFTIRKVHERFLEYALIVDEDLDEVIKKV